MSITDREKTLAKLFAKMFIARPDIRAIQRDNGEYEPQRPSRDPNRPSKYKEQLGFDLSSLVAHIRGEQTYGHYMVNTDDKVKLFAFDIDLEKPGPNNPHLMLPRTKNTHGEYSDFVPGNPRELWMSRKQGPARDMIKFQLRMLANELARTIQDELEIPIAVAYSGSKGIHVYGFTGPTTASLARQGAAIALEAMGTWELTRGNNFYQYKPKNPLDSSDLVMNFGQYSLEVYPKQDSLDGKDLGNLMRLPLGVNRKSPKDPTFFMDLRVPFSDITPMDPIEALTTTDPWRYPGE